MISQDSTRAEPSSRQNCEFNFQVTVDGNGQHTIPLHEKHICTLDDIQQERRRGLNSWVSSEIDKLICQGQTPQSVFDEVSKLTGLSDSWLKKEQIIGHCRTQFAKMNIQLPENTKKTDTNEEIYDKIRHFVEIYKDKHMKMEMLDIEGELSETGWGVAIWCETGRTLYREILLLESIFGDDTFNCEHSDEKVTLLQTRSHQKTVILMAVVHSRVKQEVFQSIYRVLFNYSYYKLFLNYFNF